MTIYCDHRGQFSFFEPPPRFPREGELWLNFLKYHKDHPEVYENFKKGIKECFEGDNKVSSYMVRETMRLSYEESVDNNLGPYYLRILIEEFPEYERFFRLRTLKKDKVKHERRME